MFKYNNIYSASNMAAKLDSLVCVKDFETEACRNLPKSAYEYYARGVGDEQTLLDNVLAYKRYVLRKSFRFVGFLYYSRI